MENSSKSRIVIGTVTWKRLFLIALGLCGVQFCWAIQVGNTTRTLLELGLAPNLVSMAWLAGPVAGIVVQPIVGTLSDRYKTTIGRRSPFILAGSFLSAIALLLFGNAQKLGAWLEDKHWVNSQWMERNGNLCGLVIAILAFWMLDFSLNAVQGPLRALMADIAPLEQQEQGNAYFALMTGVGNLLGNMLGSIPLSNYVSFISSDICALYTMGAVIISITSSICVFFAKERNSLSLTTYHGNQYWTLTSENSQLMEESNSLQREQEAQYESGGWRRIILEAPTPFWKLFLIQCFTWFAWFTEFVFITSWMGSEVMQGNPDDELDSAARSAFDYGVRMGNVGLSLQSVLSIVYALILPNIVQFLDIQYCYLLSQFLLVSRHNSMVEIFYLLWKKGFCLCWTPLLTNTHSVLWSVVSIALLGIPWASTITIPWAMMSRAVRVHRPDKIGMYSTIFNLSQCFPEILVSVIAEKMLGRLNRQTSVLAMGGGVALVGSLLIFTL